MSSHGEELVYFCELCQAPIASNRCTVHGIDFVTIKKADEVPRPPDGDERGLAPVRQTPEQTPRTPPVDTPVRRTDGTPPARIDDAAADLPARSGDSTLAPDAGSDSPDPEPDPDMPYHDAEVEIPHFQSTEAGGGPPIPGFGPAGRRRLWIPGTLAIALVVVGLGGWNIWKGEGLTPGDIYAMADVSLSDGDSSTARVLYRDFLRRFPADPLTPLVEQRMAILAPEAAPDSTSTDPAVDAEDSESAPLSEAQQAELATRLREAESAFRSGRLVTPEGGGAAGDVARMLAIDPDNAAALELQARIVTHFRERAETALAGGDRRAAIDHYRTALRVQPTNAAVLAAVHALLTER